MTSISAFVRERFNIPWSRSAERRYRAIRASIRTGWPYVPASFRWYPAARKGWLRERGRIPARL
ncbi:hypothetical protein [Mycolicibacterium sp. XJ879]